MSLIGDQTSLTVQLDPELKSAFTAAVEAEHTKADQVMRRLIRAYLHERARRDFHDEVTRQCRELAKLASEPGSDEYAVLQEIEAEFDRDDFAGEWRG